MGSPADLHKPVWGRLRKEIISYIAVSFTSRFRSHSARTPTRAKESYLKHITFHCFQGTSDQAFLPLCFNRQNERPRW